jgi:hypothetical protein
VRAEATGEEPVAVDDVDEVAAPCARCLERAGDELRPDVDVLPGVPDDGRLAGRARRRVDPNDILA